MFFKKKITEDYVDLSIGRIYFKPITHGMENNIRIKSTIIGSIINNTKYFTLFEYYLVDLPKRKIDNLSLKDGNKLRNKLKEILLRHGLLEKPVEQFGNEWDNQEKNWFQKAKMAGLNKLQGGK